MPGPYSYDLRVRVIAAVEKGMDVVEASRTFGLHRDTIRSWLARKEATGDVQAKTGYQHGHSQKITDPKRFQTFLQQQGDATVEELAEAWGGVKRMTIWRQLRKLGYTHKKRPFATPSGRRN
jgi:transposase